MTKLSLQDHTEEEMRKRKNFFSAIFFFSCFDNQEVTSVSMTKSQIRDTFSVKVGWKWSNGHIMVKWAYYGENLSMWTMWKQTFNFSVFARGRWPRTQQAAWSGAPLGLKEATAPGEPGFTKNFVGILQTIWYTIWSPGVPNTLTVEPSALCAPNAPSTSSAPLCKNSQVGWKRFQCMCTVAPSLLVRLGDTKSNRVV